jgi:RecA-family ATPase
MEAVLSFGGVAQDRAKSGGRDMSVRERLPDRFEDGTTEPPVAVMTSIASWRRIFANRQTNDVRGLLHNAARDLFRTRKVSRTVYPDCDAIVNQTIVDALADLADSVGINADDAQLIFSKAQNEKPAEAMNGHPAIDEPPPATSPDEYGIQSEPIAATNALIVMQGDEPRPLAFFDPTEWEGLSVPPRRWLVPHRIPLSNVTMLNGDGSAGKTTIALQLAVATTRGVDWLGSIIDEPGPAIFFTAEEDKDEIHRRLAAIVEHQGIGFRDLARLHPVCMPGADAVFGIPDRFGVIHATPLFESLCAAASKIRPTLIAIESAADVFAGNENDRAQVRQFIALLRRLALTTGAAVLLIAHPSLTGMATGTGTSGSTAWNNSVRSRLYFTGAKKSEDDDESDIRELKVMKSNYGPAGEVVRLRWDRGIFVPEGGPGTLERVAAEAAVDQAYLDCLDAAHGSGRQVGPYTGKAYAPSIFAQMPQAKGYRAKALAGAQERLFNAGRIEVRKVGPPSKALDRIFRKAAP